MIDGIKATVRIASIDRHSVCSKGMKNIHIPAFSDLRSYRHMPTAVQEIMRIRLQNPKQPKRTRDGTKPRREQEQVSLRGTVASPGLDLSGSGETGGKTAARPKVRCRTGSRAAVPWVTLAKYGGKSQAGRVLFLFG